MEELTIIDQSASLEALNRSEIDMQIATAKRYPRSVAKFVEEVKELASHDVETAASCFYKKPMGDGKFVEGNSVRLAEIMLTAWGNVRAASRIIADDGKSVTAQAVCIDLEKNVSVCTEVKRSVLYKNGNRYKEDQVITTCNAACSIAQRNAIFKVIPGATIKRVIDEVKMVAARQIADLSTMRNSIVNWYAAKGVTEKQLLEYVGVAGVEEMTADMCLTLRGLCQAINDGDVTVESAILDELKNRKKAAEAEKKQSDAQSKVAAAMAANNK